MPRSRNCPFCLTCSVFWISSSRRLMHMTVHKSVDRIKLIWNLLIARGVAKMTLHYFQIMLLITYCVVSFFTFKRLK